MIKSDSLGRKSIIIFGFFVLITGVILIYISNTAVVSIIGVILMHSFEHIAFSISILYINEISGPTLRSKVSYFYVIFSITCILTHFS